MPNLVNGVTRENFTELAKTYSELNGGVHFGVSLVPWVLNHELMLETIPQWGAWRWYRKRNKMLTLFMDKRGKEGKSYTVPAEWPHLFDGDATVQEDYEVGELFRRNYRPENIVMADKATREAFIAGLKLKFPHWSKPAPTPESHLVVPVKSNIDMDLLLKSYDVGMASKAKPKFDTDTGEIL
jgi:hypothetical protein